MSWQETCREKINELRLIADWGAITNLGKVRDACRTAISAIEADLARFDDPAADLTANKQALTPEHEPS